MERQSDEQIMEYRLDGVDDTSILVEIHPPAHGFYTEVPLSTRKRGQVTVLEAPETFDAVMRSLGRTANVIAKSLRAGTGPTEEQADETRVEFGVQLGSGVGAVIASAHADVHIRVVLMWKAKR